MCRDNDNLYGRRRGDGESEEKRVSAIFICTDNQDLCMNHGNNMAKMS